MHFIRGKPLFHNFGSPAAHFGLIRLSQFLNSSHFAFNLSLVLAKAGICILLIESSL